MLFPERMFLVTVFVARDQLARLVHVLHSLRRVHLIDAVEGEGDDFLRPAGDYVYFPVESHLMTLQSIKEYLRVSPPKQIVKIHEGELMATLIDRLDILVTEVRKRRERLEALQGEAQAIRSDLDALAPLTGLSVRLDLLGDYETLDAVAVAMSPVAPPLPAQLTAQEVAEAKQRHKSVRFFVSPRREAEALRQFLAQQKAEVLPLPKHRPPLTPGAQMQNLQRRLREIEAEISKIEEDLAKIREENSLFICAAEEELLDLLEKNRGAAYFASSDYVLAGRFWVAESDLARVKAAIQKRFSEGLEMLVEEAPTCPPHGESKPQATEIPPTRLRNVGPARPFESFIEMLGIPAYHEIDPTWFMALCFPLFLGFIIGDCGYGLALAGLGLLLRRRLGKSNRELGDLLYCLMFGGASAALFGFFVFGDCLGIPFHPEPTCAFAWHEWFPWLPHPLIVKTSDWGVAEMLTLAIVAGWLHMSAGCVFGMVNACRHGLRHLLARVGQLALIMAMAVLVLSLESFRHTGVGLWLWRYPLRPMDSLGIFPSFAGLLLVGAALALVGEGIKAALEIFGFLSNVVSFTRLALVGVSKATAVSALNSFILPLLSTGGSWLTCAFLVAGLAVGHFIFLLLGALSGSIQALRLHYCETFGKFFEGNGKKFVAFGMERAYTEV